MNNTILTWIHSVGVATLPTNRSRLFSCTENQTKVNRCGLESELLLKKYYYVTTMVTHCIALIASFITVLQSNWGISFPGKRNQQRKQKSNLKSTVPMEVFVTKGHTKVSKWYHWKKTGGWFNPRWVISVPGPWPKLPLTFTTVYRITTFATQSSNKAWVGV